MIELVGYHLACHQAYEVFDIHGFSLLDATAFIHQECINCDHANYATDCTTMPLLHLQFLLDVHIMLSLAIVGVDFTIELEVLMDDLRRRDVDLVFLDAICVDVRISPPSATLNSSHNRCMLAANERFSVTINPHMCQ